METNARPITTCLHRLLCRKYLVVQFETVSIHVQLGGPVRDCALRWALGVLADGQFEVVGAWLSRRLDSECWEAVFDDLRMRGAESIRFVSSSGQAGLHSAVSAAYPDAIVLPSKGLLLHQTPASAASLAVRGGELAASRQRVLDAGGDESAPNALDWLSNRKHGLKYFARVQPGEAPVQHRALLDEVPPRFRRAIQSGDAAVQQMHSSLRRAIARRGCFADQKAAVSFAVGALERADSRLRAFNADLTIAMCPAESAGARSAWKNGASAISPILA